MPTMNLLFWGLHVYVFVLTLLITLSAWQQPWRWVGLAITVLALIIAVGPLVNPGPIAPLQFPLKVAIFIGAVLITLFAKRTDTRYIGLLLIVAAGGAAAAHLITF